MKVLNPFRETCVIELVLLGWLPETPSSLTWDAVGKAVRQM